MCSNTLSNNDVFRNKATLSELNFRFMRCCSLIASAPNFSTSIFWCQGLVNWRGRQDEHLVEGLLKTRYMLGIFVKLIIDWLEL